MISAHKTGQIQGGISFFKKIMQRRKNKRFTWKDYLDPENIINKAFGLLEFPSHPSHTERIANLEKLKSFAT